MVGIKLPDYKKIALEVKRNKVFVEEGEVEAELQWLQKSRAKFSQKLSPCQTGDFVEIEFSSPKIEKGRVFRDGFILGKGHFLPGFEENLEGLKPGQEKEFSFSPPPGGKLEPGKTINFRVKIISVQKVEFPEINDQFAQNLGRFKNLEDLKESIREGLNLEKEKLESQRVRAEILEKIAEKSELEVPEDLVEKEKERLFQNLKNFLTSHLKVKFEDYLKRIKKPEEELLDSLKVQAQKRVKHFLILGEIAKRENIEVSEGEVIEEINKILKHYPSIERAKREIDLEKLKSYTKEVLRNEKTLAFLEGFSH